MLYRTQPVAVARRVLEALFARRLLHLALELSLDRLHVAGEELDHAVDDRAVVLLRHVAHAGSQAAVDVVVEARDARVPTRLRPLAWAVREDAVQDVERLANLLRVRVRPEIPDARPVPLPGEHHTRIFVLDRDRDVGERLVVAEADVEGRPVPLDEVLLEMECLDLRPGDDHLDVLDSLRQALNLRATVLGRLEIGAHARPQRLGLPDVENVAFRVAEQVDARRRRELFQLLL